MLRRIEKTHPDHFSQAEKHNLTNEIFILTEGEADLLVFENGAIPGKEYIVQMKKSVAYNIPQGVWHHIVMSSDAHVVLIEKSDTSRENSSYHFFDEEKKKIYKNKN
ncbi:MAG: hypothetical protein HC906_03785 [Bacteroidales bacterium]|nr:hypothetical protein [Bacteroidales bacterium]